MKQAARRKREEQSVTMLGSYKAAMSRSLMLGLSVPMIAIALHGCNLTGGNPGDKSTALIANESDGSNWPSYGRTYSEQHFSPLAAINAANVQQMGLAWSLELPGAHSAAGVPIEVNGILYFSADLSKVHAVDAATGKLLWVFDPETYKHAGPKLRFSWGARGIAYWENKIYVGTTDGRLIAIDAKSGKEVWSRLTVDPKDTSGITGAPRVFNGLVVIGQASGEYARSRDYVTAYDAATGAQRWRFFTVPGNPAKGFEDDAQAMAARTWTGEWWKFGGGGPVWNAITYDPELDQIYIGVGNGQPWNYRIRSPKGGDNLFISSIVALDAKTGKYKWHYQEIPGNSRDYDVTTDITTATFTLAGKPRKVLMTAAKDGMFYVIDRISGKLISGDAYSLVNWNTGIDAVTGRPKVVPQFAADDPDFITHPASSGAHTWQPQSFNPKIGLFFTPTLQLPDQYSDEGVDVGKWQNTPGQVNLGTRDYDTDGPADAGRSTLLAWDPIKRQKVWEISTPGFWNGGTLATAGNLLFQGWGNGYFNAFAADTGKRLWSFNARMGIVGAPITYSINGVQYVTVLAGWGGSGAGYMGSMTAQEGWLARVHTNRVVTFVIGGKASLPANLPPPQMVVPLNPADFRVDPAKAAAGRTLFARTCFMCHGVGAVAAGYAPDLRASSVPLDADAFAQVVHGGALLPMGMPKYDELTSAQLEQLRHYLRWVVRFHRTPATPAPRP
jgi:quinohemoprotein ethanol dehydrogenase